MPKRLVVYDPDMINRCRTNFFCQGKGQQTCNLKFFRAGEVLRHQDTSIKNLYKAQEKNSPARRFRSFSSQRLLKLNLSGICNPKNYTIRALFCQNRGTFFEFQKREWEASLLLPQSPGQIQEWQGIDQLILQHTFCNSIQQSKNID